MTKKLSDGVFPMIMLWWLSTFIFFIQLWVIYSGLNDDKIKKWCENKDTNNGSGNAEEYKKIMKNLGVAVMGIMTYFILLSLAIPFIGTKQRSIMYTAALFIFMFFLSYIYGSTTVFYDKVKDSLCGRFSYGGFDSNNVQGGHAWVIDSGCEWSCNRDDECAKQNGTEYACGENDFKACDDDDASKLAESGCGQCYKPSENYPIGTTLNLVGSWIFVVGILMYAIRDKGLIKIEGAPQYIRGGMPLQG